MDASTGLITTQKLLTIILDSYENLVEPSLCIDSEIFQNELIEEVDLTSSIFTAIEFQNIQFHELSFFRN